MHDDKHVSWNLASLNLSNYLKQVLLKKTQTPFFLLLIKLKPQIVFNTLTP